jgi:hypothetical protein
MQVLAGPFVASAVLLVLAGAAKVRRPGPTVAALAAVRVRVPGALVVTLGAAEAAIGLGAMLLGSRPFAVLVAACYLGFAAFVGAALLRGGTVSSCGCFGQADTPPTRMHLGLDLAAAAVAVLAALRPVDGLAGALAARPLLLALAAVCAWLAYVSLSLLPQTVAAAGSRAR